MLGSGGARDLDDAVAVTAAAKAGFTPDDVRRRATDVLERAYRNGTTVIRTPVDVDPTVGLASLDVLLALREEWADRIAIQVVAFPQEGIAARPGTGDLLDVAGHDLAPGSRADLVLLDGDDVHTAVLDRASRSHPRHGAGSGQTAE